MVGMPQGGDPQPPMVADIAAQPPRTYREWYSNAANNPRQEEPVAVYMHGYHLADPGGGLYPPQHTN